jgi:hypothetical protein
MLRPVAPSHYIKARDLYASSSSIRPGNGRSLSSGERVHDFRDRRPLLARYRCCQLRDGRSRHLRTRKPLGHVQPCAIAPGRSSCAAALRSTSWSARNAAAACVSWQPSCSRARFAASSAISVSPRTRSSSPLHEHPRNWTTPGLVERTRLRGRAIGPLRPSGLGYAFSGPLGRG